MKRQYTPEDFEAAFGITKHDYKCVPGDDGPTWREICERAAEVANNKYSSVFKEGDRVAIYKRSGPTGYRVTGTVTKHKGMHPGQIKVFIDGNEGALSAYPHECVRLVKKVRSAWVDQVVKDRPKK